MGRDFGPLLLGIDRVFFAVNDKVVDAVFHVRERIGRADQPLRIGFILREEERRRAFRVKEALTEISMRERDDPAGFILSQLTKGGAGRHPPPTTSHCETRGWAGAGASPVPGRGYER